jgi:CubicO group peptidase (beta-lactamase class C family)
MKKNTVFDLASLTKPIVTACSTMLLHERNLLQLNARLRDILPELKNSASADKTIWQLLTHTSGLPAWYPTYLLPAGQRLKNIADLNMGNEKVKYSCLGFILLGKIVEQVAQMSLARFFKQKITDKLRVGTTRFDPMKDKENVAPTENGNNHEADMTIPYGDISNIAWRKDLIHGEVHDGNAFYAFNSIAGNAGLFSCAEDLARVMQAYLSGEILSKRTLEIMTKDHTGGDDKRGLGWKMDMYPGLLAPDSYGHTGFTGTLVVIDPQQDLIIILLANAVHPDVKLGLMNPIRREAVRLITEILKTT